EIKTSWANAMRGLPARRFEINLTLHGIRGPTYRFHMGRTSRKANCRSASAEPTRGKWSDVDRGGTAGDEVGDDFAGHRRRGHSDMAVAKGVDHVPGRVRRTQHRQRIRQARTMAH